MFVVVVVVVVVVMGLYSFGDEGVSCSVDEFFGGGAERTQ